MGIGGGIVVSIFNVNGGNVIGQQYYFISVEFMLVFAFQVLHINQTTLQQTHQECSCSRKGVEDVNVFIRNAAVKFLFQDIIYRMHNKIHYLYRGVYDTQFFHHFWKSGFEEFIVQFNNDSLLPSALSIPSALLRTES